MPLKTQEVYPMSEEKKKGLFSRLFQGLSHHFFLSHGRAPFLSIFAP